jgi:hypothetical protein
MAARPRSALALVLTLLGLALVAGCGGSGSGSKKASSDTPVNQLLQQTFSGSKQVKSGVLDLSLRLTAQGSSQLSGPIALRLSGPFESQGKGKLPKFKFSAAVSGEGQNLTAGVTSTVAKGFVDFQGTEYAVTDNVWSQFRKGYEQSQAQARSQKPGQSLSSLGIDPRRWLTSPRNAGDGKVGDTDVVRITGGVDVNKLLADVNTLLAKGRALGGSATKSIPNKLTPQQMRKAAQAIKNPTIEIDTGKDDSILRRALVNFGVTVPKSSTAAAQSGTVSLDLKLTDLNQSQDISAPANAKPFDQLLGSLGSLGLGGLGSGSGSGSGSSGSGTSGTSSQNLQKYSQCISDAGSDSAKASKCANLLTP